MSGLNVLKTSPRATLLAAWLVLAVFAQFVDQRVADDPPLFGKWTETVDRFGLARRQCISGRQSGTGQTLVRKLGNDLSGGLFSRRARSLAANSTSSSMSRVVRIK